MSQNEQNVLFFLFVFTSEHTHGSFIRDNLFKAVIDSYVSLFFISLVIFIIDRGKIFHN